MSVGGSEALLFRSEDEPPKSAQQNVMSSERNSSSHLLADIRQDRAGSSVAPPRFDVFNI